MAELKVKTVKKTVKKDVVKPSVKTVAKKVEKPTGLKTDVYGVDGSVSGSVTLPEVLFGATVNKQLIAQAVRVYLANQREGSAHTKTRGEVTGSTRKIYKQKGTGNARHGSIRAPIFVGGGNVFGPLARDFSLDMPKKMKVRALASALTQQYQAGAIKILAGFTSLEEKTKAYATMLRAVSPFTKTVVLLSAGEMTANTYLRNIDGVTVIRAQDAYTYAVVSTRSILITEAALAEIQKP